MLCLVFSEMVGKSSRASEMQAKGALTVRRSERGFVATMGSGVSSCCLAILRRISEAMFSPKLENRFRMIPPPDFSMTRFTHVSSAGFSGFAGGGGRKVGDDGGWGLDAGGSGDCGWVR